METLFQMFIVLIKNRKIGLEAYLPYIIVTLYYLLSA